MASTPRGLVIFDCDGVLVDSEAIAAAVLTETLAGLGTDIDEATVYRRFLGRSLDAVRDVLAQEYGLTSSGDIIPPSFRERLIKRFRAELKPIPGVAEAVKRINLARCVASSSRPERLRLTLGLTGLLPLFDPNIFSTTMVLRGKPAPDLFLHAASAMNISPSDCVVIEDSPAGVEAAKRAGMRVFAFTGGAHAAASNLNSLLAALAPDAIFDDMLRLPELLAEEPGLH